MTGLELQVLARGFLSCFCWLARAGAMVGLLNGSLQKVNFLTLLALCACDGSVSGEGGDKYRYFRWRKAH
jgi:hypothetical protein